MLQGSFASGRYTSTVLFVLSMLVMLAAYWLPEPAVSFVVEASDGGFPMHLLSLLLYVFAAVLLSRQTFFDRSVKWKGALYLWFAALSTFVNGDVSVAFASLLFMVSVMLLLFCQYSANPVGLFYTAFMLLGVLCFVTPYSLYLIPLYLLFCSITNTFSPRGVAASLLGLATPFWLVFGIVYVFPRVDVLLEPVIAGFVTVFDVNFLSFSLLNLLLLVFVLAVLLPAIYVFVGSASPSKPLLRRRLSFVIVANIYLLLLSGIIGGGAGFFYVCQLPFVAILASYLFAIKESKLSNVYFVLVNAMMLAIATHTLWLKL